MRITGSPPRASSRVSAAPSPSSVSAATSRPVTSRPQVAALTTVQLPQMESADLAALEIERESRDIALYSTLADAHGRYQVAQLDVQRTRTDVLPRLLRAEQAAERAYRAGAVSYLEWAQLQSQTTATRRQQLDAALDAQAALIEIQRLTGQAFVAAPAASPEGTTP